MIQTIRNHKNKNTRCYNNENRVYVQSHLSVTPSEMNQMRERGIPISSQCDPSQFYDGDNSPCVSIDPMMMRGVDILDAWNAEQTAKNRLNQANKNDIKTYGK